MIKRILDNFNAIQKEGLERYSARKFQAITKYKAPLFTKYKHLFEDKDAIEIGGLSSIFQPDSLFPIYQRLSSVDGCNFSTDTVWEGKIAAGKNYNYHTDKVGYQYICEASEIHNFVEKQYDVLLSSHSLEHIANPLKALQSWHKILSPKGIFLLILPNPAHTFDNKRPITTFDHLLNDYEQLIDERDMTCLEEVITLHNFKKDPYGEKEIEAFKQRCNDNYNNRCLHHHVFDDELIKKMLKFANFEFIALDKVLPYHIITLAQKI
jgi:SAM-dependent methyltransferase